jgi:uncharacterized protein
MAKINCMIKGLFLAMIKIYQYFLSPLIPPSCRFHPSCSDYALESLEKNGVFKGSWCTIKRLCRCHPWAQGGYDPVEPN